MLRGWTRLRQLSAVWWSLWLAFVAVAVVLFTVSEVWRTGDTAKLDKHTLRRLTIKTDFLNGECLPVVDVSSPAG